MASDVGILMKHFWLVVAYTSMCLLTFGIGAFVLLGIIATIGTGSWLFILVSVVAVPVTVASGKFTWWVCDKAVDAKRGHR